MRKAQPGKTIFSDGSSQLVHTLLREDLVDELLLYPLALGGGKRGLPDQIAAVISSDPRETVVLTDDGRRWNLRAAEIAGVSARDRARGAAVGAAASVA